MNAEYAREIRVPRDCGRLDVELAAGNRQPRPDEEIEQNGEQVTTEVYGSMLAPSGPLAPEA